MQDLNDNGNHNNNPSIWDKLSLVASFIFREIVELVGFIKNVLDVFFGSDEKKKKAKDEFKKDWIKICKHVGLIMLIFGTNPIVLLCAFAGYKISEVFKKDLCQSEKSKKVITWSEYIFVPVIVLVFGINSALFAIIGILLLGFYNLASNFDSIIQKLVGFNGGYIFGINIKEKLEDTLNKINTYEKNEQPATADSQEIEITTIHEENNI